MADENTQNLPIVTTPPVTPPDAKPGDDFNDEGWDPKTREYVTKIRNEAKERRLEAQTLRQKYGEVETQLGTLKTKLKSVFGSDGTEGEGGDEIAPEQHIEMLQHEIAARDAHIEFVQSSNSLGIYDPKDQQYFQFLLNQHMEDQEEGYEIPDEVLDELVGDVLSRSKTKRAGPGGNTSFSSGKTPSDRQDSGAGQVTLEAFRKMGTSERSNLFVKDRASYDRLFEQLNKK